MLSGHSLADASGRLLAVDPRTCEILQRREGDLLGRSYQEFTHPDDVARNTRLVDLLRVGDRALVFTKRYVRSDRSTILAKVHVSRVEGLDGGRLLGTIEPLTRPAAPDFSRRWQTASAAAAGLRRRRAELGADLFGDLAYALLLELYLAEAEGRLIGEDALATHLTVSPMTLTRWLRVLIGKGLLERVGGADGAPQLTLDGIRKIERLLDLAGDG